MRTALVAERLEIKLLYMIDAEPRALARATRGPGQARLRCGSVLVVGAGGLGCAAALYLAGAGVGTLVLADGDAVEVGNLHRQVAHTLARVGQNKARSAAAACAALVGHGAEKSAGFPAASHGTCLRAVPAPLACAADAVRAARVADVVLDCTDDPGAGLTRPGACSSRRPLGGKGGGGWTDGGSAFRHTRATTDRPACFMTPTATQRRAIC